MTSQIASFVGRRFLKETVQNRFGQTDDPYFEQVPASRLHRAFGKKTVRRRKAVPPGLSDNDAKILTRVKRRAYSLDYSLFSLCGIRFGWGSVIGLVPFAGDGMDAALAMMVARDCYNIDGGLPSHIQARMLVNIVFDFVIGLVPFIGDLADAVYKCNTRNAVILETYLREQATIKDKKQRKRDRQHRQVTEPVDLSIPEEFDRYESNMLEDPPEYEQQDISHVPQLEQGNDAGPPSLPAPSSSTSKSKRAGWFGGQRPKQSDLETGVVRR